jgi:hypothetical protein
LFHLGLYGCASATKPSSSRHIFAAGAVRTSPWDSKCARHRKIENLPYTEDKKGIVTALDFAFFDVTV